MREVVVSAATLAGLVGLACLYGNGKDIGRSRVAREADFEAINDVNYDVLGDNLPGEMSEADLVQAERNFMMALGYLDGSVDVPELLEEDVKVYQQAGGNAKKAVQFVAKCMKNSECKTNAIRKVKNWSYDQWNFLKSDDNRPSFMKPFVKELLPIKTQDYDWTATVKAAYKAEKDKTVKQAWGETLAFEACTPYDNMLWRCPPDQDKTPAKLTQGFGWSEDAETLAQFDAEKLAAPSLLDFEASVSDAGRNDYQDNAFGTFGKGVKIIYIIPNGIPIFMHDEVILDKDARNAGKTSQFRNYWDWFVAFNDKYIGIKKGVNVKNRQNTGWWFIRQDEVGLPYTKSIVKASKRFPWSRFETRLVVPQYTAVAPKVTTTYRTIESAMFGADKESIPIDMRIPSEASKDGNDCFIFWFHQYVPTDIFALNKEEHQERILKIESVCTVKQGRAPGEDPQDRVRLHRHPHLGRPRHQERRRLRRHHQGRQVHPEDPPAHPPDRRAQGPEAERLLLRLQPVRPQGRGPVRGPEAPGEGLQRRRHGQVQDQVPPGRPCHQRHDRDRRLRRRQRQGERLLRGHQLPLRRL